RRRLDVSGVQEKAAPHLQHVPGRGFQAPPALARLYTARDEGASRVGIDRHVDQQLRDHRRAPARDSRAVQERPGGGESGPSLRNSPERRNSRPLALVRVFRQKGPHLKTIRPFLLAACLLAACATPAPHASPPPDFPGTLRVLGMAPAIT